MKVINADGLILGRLASYAAKQALQGKKIIILNSEKVIITGKRSFIIPHYQGKRRRGGTAQKGPNFSRLPEKNSQKDNKRNAARP